MMIKASCQRGPAPVSIWDFVLGFQGCLTNLCVLLAETRWSVVRIADWFGWRTERFSDLRCIAGMGNSL
jgi:hypothetical protein